MPKIYSDPKQLASDIVAGIGPKVTVGLPLGLGKANHIANALFDCAAQDSKLRLTFFTALTLEKPAPASDLERRFISPVIERLFGGYPDLAYAKALRDKSMPANVDVVEFFFLAGRWMRVAAAQQNYISANYTHAAPYLLTRGVDVITQLVAKRVVNGETRYSLSCNTDTALELLKARKEGRTTFRMVGQVNSELPFMTGPGDLSADEFDAILDSEATDFPLFAPPSEPVSDTKYAIGLHAASLIRDGGSLQIGIGQVGDALARGLIVRDRDNAAFIDIMQRLSPAGLSGFSETTPFAKGIYGVSEMLFDAFLGLIEAGIVRREVEGACMHAAFFIGSKDFYRRLREMPAEQAERIQMVPVSFTNEIYGDEDGKRRARVDARFVNSVMMATLMGAAVSDGLENGQVVSGVGGQYNFVAQAFALEGARSILTLESVRGAGKKAASNIRWSYGHTTIPRHLRDVVVTEYGVADLRGRSDADVIAAMLAISDSRFQGELMREAKDAGKLPREYEIPKAHRDNTPERITAALKPYRESGVLPAFPFGTDFTEAEQRLIPALQTLKAASESPLSLAQLALEGFAQGASSSAQRDETKACLVQECLARLGLDQPHTWSERLYRHLVRAALARNS